MPEAAKNLKTIQHAEFEWLPTGDEALEEMLRAIRGARVSIRLEMYIFHPGATAESFRQALVEAARSGVKVQVLLDALGSVDLPESFWDELKASGGEFRWFNPLSLHRIGVRDHRKILICDEKMAFIGGYNIADEYAGDGVSRGWRDLGLKLRGPLVSALSQAFDDMFQIADFQHKRFARLRKSTRQKTVWAPNAHLLLSAPGRQRSPLKHALVTDFSKAKKIQIMAAYFLPTWRLRRLLMRVARRGGKVQIILPAKSDVPLMQLASRSLYRRLLRAGVEIYEYEPQILHAKLIVVDDKIAYAGSANLDIRSLHLNYELLARIEDRKLAQQAAELFKADLVRSRRIYYEQWVRERHFWSRLKSRLAYWIFVRLDPYLVSRQLRRLR